MYSTLLRICKPAPVLAPAEEEWDRTRSEARRESCRKRTRDPADKRARGAKQRQATCNAAQPISWMTAGPRRSHGSISTPIEATKDSIGTHDASATSL